MGKKELRKVGVLVCFLAILVTGYAQYTVSGGKGTPLLAYDDSPNRVEVYLVYGMENVIISYTSTTTSSHQWFRYKNKYEDAQKIPSEQQGNTSTVRNLEEGYGYFVEEGNRRYIWLIDYSKYPFNISNLSVLTDSNPCEVVKLAGDGTASPLVYYRPSGIQWQVERTFDIIYNTLEFSEQNKMFQTKEVLIETPNPLNKSIDAPYCDTPFRLSGDHFARHFGVEKTIQTDEYQTVALLVRGDTTVISNEGENMSSQGGGISLPATIRFTGYANEPVAARYQWKIYRHTDEGTLDSPLVQFPGEEVEYTFTLGGTYTAVLEVSDRTFACTDSTLSFTFETSETILLIPNAFSPGTSPGINDEFRVVYKSVNEFKGWIFNRWGNEMFRWNDPAVGWDGKKGGKYVSPGVYFYVIEYRDAEGKKKSRSGHINILRSKTIQDEVIE